LVQFFDNKEVFQEWNHKAYQKITEGRTKGNILFINVISLYKIKITEKNAMTF